MDRESGVANQFEQHRGCAAVDERQRRNQALDRVRQRRKIERLVGAARLAGAGVIPPGADASMWVLELRAHADSVVPSFGPLPASTAEETELALRWLESDGVRLVHIDGEWTSPLRGAGRHLAVHQAAREARRSLVQFDR